MNATDRVDASIESSLVRAVSHQPYTGDLEPLKSIRSHVSHHAHFADPEPGTDSDDTASSHQAEPLPVFDIEHAPVDDDPREWSHRKQTLVLALMTAAVLGPMISPSIYNPVVDEVQQDLHGTETEIGLSLSIYILLQGCVPVIWASAAEIIGRKKIYLSSFILYTIGSAVASRAPNMSVLIGMRCLQAMGSSAVLSVGAGSLADMYEVKDRGKKLGLYYGMPMLGPTLGPLIGGALGNVGISSSFNQLTPQAYGWRSTMYFLAVFAFIMTFLFLFFPDTWRKERSRVYQKAIADTVKRTMKAEAAAEKKRLRKLTKGLSSTATTPAETRVGTPAGTRPGSLHEEHVDVELGGNQPAKRRLQMPWSKKSDGDHVEMKPGLRDVNPVPTMISIFHSPTNTFVLCSSGILFAAQYTTTYTASLTFSRAPYNYSPLIIGVVLLAFGVGNIFGSVLGGRASDMILKRLAAKNGGVTVPEMRLKSTFAGMLFIIISYLIYGWTCHYKTSIAGPVVALFIAGFSLMFVYTSTLAYLVDSNPGRSSSAVSCNSFCRGVGSCVMSQVAMPLQNSIGDGGLYTLFAGMLLIACSGLTLIAYRGEKWRASQAKRVAARAKRKQQPSPTPPAPSITDKVTATSAPTTTKA